MSKFADTNRREVYHVPGSGSELLTHRRLAWFILIFAALLLGTLSVFVNPKYLIGVVVLVASSVFLFSRPFVGLILYTITFFLRPGELFPAIESLHVERLIGIFVLVSMFVGAKIQKRKVEILNSPQAWAIILFATTLVLSLPNSYWPSQTRWEITDFLKVVAFFILICNLIDTEKRLRIFIWTYMILIAYIAFDSLKGYYTGQIMFAQGIERAVGGTSAGGDPNSLANTMDITIPFLIFVAMTTGVFWHRLVLMGSIGLMSWVVLISGSRGGFLGLFVMLGCLWFTLRNKLVWAIGGVLAVLLIWFMLPDQYQERYSSIVEMSDNPDASTEGRYEAWAAGRQMFVDNPIIGVGAGAFGTAHAEAYSPKFRRSYLKAHNLYIQLAAELGIIGIFTFGALLFTIFRTNMRIRQRLRRLRERKSFIYGVSLAITVSIVTLMFTGIFGHSLYRTHWYFCAAITAAMYEIVRKKSILAEESAETESDDTNTLPEDNATPSLGGAQ